MMHQNNKKSKAESYQSEAAERNFIGMDLSLESLDVCCAGKITKLTNDKKGLEKLFKLVSNGGKGKAANRNKGGDGLAILHATASCRG